MVSAMLSTCVNTKVLRIQACVRHGRASETQDIEMRSAKRLKDSTQWPSSHQAFLSRDGAGILMALQKGQEESSAVGLPFA